MAGVEDERRHVVRDYLPVDDDERVDHAMISLASLPTDEVLNPNAVTAVLDLQEGADLESSLQPRGYRLLGRIPRIQESLVESVVSRYGALQKVMRATVEDLENIPGVDAATARMIKDGLARLAESSILDRYS
jgi:diadenylate cyclase